MTSPRTHAVDLHSAARLAVLTCGTAAVWIAVHTYFTLLNYLTGSMCGWLEMALEVFARSVRWSAIAPVAIVVAQRLRFEKRHRVRDGIAVGAVLTLVTMAAPLLTTGELRVGTGHPNGVTLAALAIMFGYILAAREESAALRRRREQSERLLTRLRDELVRARIAPRFLFAALDEIAGDVRRNPAHAERTLLDFSEFLRAFADLAPHTEITVERELDVLERFVTISLRAPLAVHADDEALQLPIAPLTIFHMVAAYAAESPRSVRVDVRHEDGVVVDVLLSFEAAAPVTLTRRVPGGQLHVTGGNN